MTNQQGGVQGNLAGQMQARATQSGLAKTSTQPAPQNQAGTLRTLQNLNTQSSAVSQIEPPKTNTDMLSKLNQQNSAPSPSKVDFNTYKQNSVRSAIDGALNKAQTAMQTALNQSAAISLREDSDNNFGAFLNKISQSGLGNNTDVSNTTYKNFIDTYNNASGDQQADIKKAIADEIVTQREYAKNGSNNSLKAIDYLSGLNSMLNQYGNDKGKSLGKQIGDYLSTGGIAGTLGRGVTQLLGNVTGNADKTSAHLEKQQNARQDLGVVGAADAVGGAIGNFALNSGTGGMYGLANAGVEGANAIYGTVNDRILDYDDNGNAVIRNKTDLEKAGDLGSAGLNAVFAVAGKAGIGPALSATGANTATGLAKLSAKDLAKYAAQELPWAAGTTYLQQGLGNLSQGKDWGDMDAGEFGKEFLVNLGQDVGMDVANYGTGRVAQNSAMKAMQNEQNQPGESLLARNATMNEPTTLKEHLQNEQNQTSTNPAVDRSQLDYTPGIDRVTRAFDESSNQKVLTSRNGIDFSLGDFGNNALQRKAGKDDNHSLSSSDIASIINTSNRQSVAGDSSFRKDNVAWFGNLPDGSRGTVITRRNALGQEEIIGAYKNNPGYEGKLVSDFGTPAQSRTGNFGLEDHSIESAIQGRELSDSTSASKLHNNSSISQNAENSNNSAKSGKPASDTTNEKLRQETLNADAEYENLRKELLEATKAAEANPKDKAARQRERAAGKALDEWANGQDIRSITQRLRILAGETDEVARGTEPLGKAADGTPEFVKRYTSQTTLDGVDNSREARQSRLKQVMDNFKKSDNPIVKKFYGLLHGDRSKSVVTNLTEAEARRYAAEGGVPIANDAKFVMTENFARHEDNDGHLTGIRRLPESETGYQIDANPLTASDIGMLDTLVKNPDSITDVGDGRDGKRLKIEKQISNRYRVVAEAVEDGKELNIVSLYKQNKSPLGEDLPASGNPSLPSASREVWTDSPRSETTSLNRNISENSESVNNLKKLRDKLQSGTETPASETPAGSSKPRVYENETEKLPDDFDVDRYVTDQVKAQKRRDKTPLRERIGDVTAELKHYLVDDAVAYERYIKDKNERLDIREGVDRVRTSDMIARQYMVDNGLKEIGKMSNKDMNKFQQYLIAKRANTLADRGIKTGRSRAADEALIKSVGNKYAKEEQIIRDYTRSMLEYSAENDLISQKLKNDLLKDNDNYVPMNRVFEAIEKKTNFKSKQLGNLSKQSVVQKLKGSERTVENPIESLMANTMRMVNEVERNKTAELIAQSKAFHEKVLAEGEEPRPGYDRLNYMVNGKKVSYEVPELIAKEMKNLNNTLPKAAENILGIFGAPTKWLRTGATEANPLFSVSNLLRDRMQTLITGNGEGVLKSNVWRNLKGTPKAVVAAFVPGKTGRKLREELNRAGVIGTEYRQTYGSSSKHLLEQLQGDSRKTTWVAEKVSHPIDFLADLIGRTEYFTRAQQYFGTSGDATAKAQAARNNTLNFSRAGATTRILNRAIPFLNAGVQGGRATVNSLKNRPIHTTLAVASLAGIAAAAKGAFEAQNPELWDRVDDSDKQQNIILPTEDAHYNPESNRVEGIIKIPVAQMAYPVMDAVNNTKGEAEDYLRLAGDIFTATTGLEAPNTEEGALPVLNQLTPTTLKLFLETIMNKSTYTGNEIVSENDAEKAPEDKGKKYTSGVAREVAKRLGVDAPIVDNFIQNWGGGLFKDLSQTLTDNPDNKKDGGGVGAMIGNGFNRRFLSGTVTSQYEIAEGLAKNYKDTVKENEAFQNLSSEDQEKVLKAIANDMTSIASMSAKVEQGRTAEIGDNKLTRRQTSIVNDGFNADSYIQSVLDKEKTYNGKSGEMGGEESGGDVSTLSGNVSDYGNTSARNNAIEISDELDDVYKSILERYNTTSSENWDKYLYGKTPEEAAAEYDLAKAKYENDVAKGDLTDVEKIKRQKEISKLEVSKNWTKDVRDAYSLASNKEDMQTLLNGITDETERANMVGMLNALNNAMYETGIISKSTYNSRGRNINNLEKESSSSSKKSLKDGMSSEEASAISAATKALTGNNCPLLPP